MRANTDTSRVAFLYEEKPPLDSIVNLLLIFAMVCYPPRNGGRICKPHIVVTLYPIGFGNF